MGTWRNSSSALKPSLAVWTAWPSRRSSRSMASRYSRLSSTMRTRRPVLDAAARLRAMVVLLGARQMHGEDGPSAVAIGHFHGPAELGLDDVLHDGQAE